MANLNQREDINSGHYKIKFIIQSIINFIILAFLFQSWS